VEILLGGRLRENRMGKNRRENETFRLEKKSIISNDKHYHHAGGVELTQKVVKREPLFAASSVNAVKILASNRGNSSTRSARETTKQLTDSGIAQYQYELTTDLG
jgi:hypothetical protein